MARPIPHELEKQIGDTLKSLIARESITQQILADDMRESLETINRICNAIHAPRHDLIVKFADYFEVSIDEIYGRANTCENCEKLVCQVAETCIDQKLAN